MTYVISLLFIVYALGLVYIINFGLRAYPMSDAPFILINAKNAQSIEHTIRRAMKKYPNREIYIIDKCGTDEMRDILIRFEKDFARIHIIG